MIRPHYALCAAARGLRATVAATTARPRSSARLRSAVFRLAVQFGSRPACLYNKSCCCVPKIRVCSLLVVVFEVSFGSLWSAGPNLGPAGSCPCCFHVLAGQSRPLLARNRSFFGCARACAHAAPTGGNGRVCAFNLQWGQRGEHNLATPRS